MIERLPKSSSRVADAVNLQVCHTNEAVSHVQRHRLPEHPCVIGCVAQRIRNHTCDRASLFQIGLGCNLALFEHCMVLCALQRGEVCGAGHDSDSNTVRL
jgi:hypothetical protein